ncbi:MAG: hypothetical protein ABFC91_02400 [Methanobacteriaceae archaeon]
MIQKISAGQEVYCHKKPGVIGAVIRYHDKNCVLTVQHLLKVGGCVKGDKVTLNRWEGRVLEIWIDYDLAVIEVQAPSSQMDLSLLGQPEIGAAYTLHGQDKNHCQIMTLGKTYHYLAFAHTALPLPGDSGSPVIQKGKVVGILLSVFYNNAAGLAASLQDLPLNTKQEEVLR